GVGPVRAGEGCAWAEPVRPPHGGWGAGRRVDGRRNGSGPSAQAPRHGCRELEAGGQGRKTTLRVLRTLRPWPPYSPAAMKGTMKDRPPMASAWIDLLRRTQGSTSAPA